ncbi:MAG: 30S ribosomal protein S17 [Candidatus Muproteobacteria bacterium RBG_16_64_10]|uniref:Small ribosomal subunit protein uS17 n=1 Tax=Candidatus Muproteobacteria bacterium RBG_16_64_10 TaxID=1817757 RepID=A0A1F6T7F8_9PROT|nr:MAG: 30S ribosomal protein S17 [Candidatus Muproteobacteria bacterium RBG_16_64_10]
MSEAKQTEAKASRTVSGRVISNRMHKTVTVQVERRIKHPLYGKFITRRTKLHAHDEANACQPGDMVLIEACRPISKTKSWRVVRVLEQARAV